jgi:hypothetical protein
LSCLCCQGQILDFLTQTMPRIRHIRFTQIDADNLRAAEVCSAEATELPVWKRPPVSVANGLCHPKALDHGSLPVMTQYIDR